MAEHNINCKFMVNGGELNNVIDEIKANIDCLDQRLTALETAAADPMTQTSSLVIPKMDEDTLADNVEKIKEAFRNLGGNIMGVTMDSAIEACNNFNKAFSNYSHAEGYYNRASNNNSYAVGYNNIIQPTTLQEQDVFIIGNEDEIWREGMKWLDDTDE